MATKQEILETQEAEIAKLTAMVETLRNGLDRIQAYADSPKFYTGGGINPLDIIVRATEVRNEVSDVEALPWGWAHTIKGIGVSGAWNWDTDPRSHNYNCGGDGCPKCRIRWEFHKFDRCGRVDFI